MMNCHVGWWETQMMDTEERSWLVNRLATYFKKQEEEAKKAASRMRSRRRR